LMFWYGLAAFWFLGTGITWTHRFFIPLGMGIVVLLVASLAVDPFLFAALLVELAVLLSIPLLAPPGSPIGQGVLRFIIFQTLALPFILLAGWSAGGVEANPADEKLLLQAVILLGLGFAFWLAAFPFYTWVSILAEEAQPFVAGFLLTVFPSVSLQLLIDFINNFAWLRDYPNLPMILRLAGTLMIATGGIWALFQQKLPQMLGYGVILENGFSLLALSLHNQVGGQVFAAMFLPRVVSVALWMMAMNLLAEKTTLDLDGISGLVFRFPVTSIALLVAIFSLGGLPLLATFPMREIILENLAGSSFTLVIWTVIGMVSFFMCGFRVLSYLVWPRSVDVGGKETIPQTIFLMIGVLSILVCGLFPQWILSGVANLVRAF
jgi:NADH-quinone oxidoreductase subunit N